MNSYQTQPNVVVEAERYHEGIEDGFMRVNTSECSACQDSCRGCPNYRPYINTTHGKVVVHNNDYIVYDCTGRRNVMSGILFQQIFGSQSRM